MKWACQRLARGIGKLVLYAELARAEDPLVEGLADELEASLPATISELKARLESK
jgi:hypothetical protein